MAELWFEWDEVKNRANQDKHGVSFEDASEVFYDPLHMLVPDRVEGVEERWHALGMMSGLVLLLVVHTSRDEVNGESVIRIISARPASRKERRLYEEQNG